MNPGMKFEIISQPSRSKGWARYEVSQGDDGVVVVSTQVALREGKLRRETVYAREFRLTPDEAETCELEHRPGSQGLLLRVTGAREAA